MMIISCVGKLSKQFTEITENFSTVYTKFQTSRNLFSYLKDTLKWKSFIRSNQRQNYRVFTE